MKPPNQSFPTMIIHLALSYYQDDYDRVGLYPSCYTLFKAKDRIVGYPISKQKESLKFSQHANNINFFVTTENSVVEI